MINRYGLSELYSPPADTTVTAHIIFVHGLFGHPRKTWSSRKARPSSSNPSSSVDGRLHDADQSNSQQPGDGTVFWPQALLPSVISDTKIFTFGYDADVDGFLSSASQNTIHQHAQSLLSDLADLRQTPEEKAVPIIFVVHSLGGIVVKEALNLSSSTVGTRLREIAPLVFGICFLGTPHRGSKSASLGKMAYNLTVIVSKRPNIRLLQGLERNSEVLDRVGTAFTQTLLKHNIAIYSFREERETRKYLLFNTIVVDADSAKIGDGKEEIGSIPADHSNMTKFEKASDIGFTRVSAQLRRWVEEIRLHGAEIPSQDQSCCLASLNDTTTRARIAEVHDAHEKTFHWLFNPAVVSFPEWLRDKGSTEQPIYWIQGKPGSGKSTLMKFAMRDPRLIELLASGGQMQWSLAAFFFHDRGSEKQKTLEGMLQELLHSIVQQLPALLRYVLPSYLELTRSQRTRTPSWDFATLKCALISIFEQRRLNIRIFLLLDALDEHHGDNELLASLLKTLVEKSDNDVVRLKLCLASRSWTVFQQHFGKCPGFAIHDHTREDIRTYIRTRLEPYSSQDSYPSGQANLTRLTDLVATRASGVFIWVRLVVNLLAKGLRDGTTYQALEEQVDAIPQELKDLYADTLRRIEPEYTSEALIMLQTALCSFVPLPLELFMISLDINYEMLKSRHQESDNDAGSSVRVVDIVKRCDEQSTSSQRSRLASRSGGLLEVVKRANLGDRPENVVQFIHQTVKEYVQSSSRSLGLTQILPPILAEDGYNFLMRTCANYHHEPASCLIQDVFSYARCAVKKVSEVFDAHSNEFKHKSYEIMLYLENCLLNSTGPYGLQQFLRQRDGRFFAYLHDRMRKDRSDLRLLLELAVAMNLPQYLLSPLTARVRKIDLLGDYGLLHIAVAAPYIGTGIHDGDHDFMIIFLVGVGWEVDEPRHQIPIECMFEDVSFDWGVTPLAQVLLTKSISTERRLSMAKTLLALGASASSKIHLRNDNTIGLLQYCVAQESAAFVRLLLQYGAEPNPDLLRLARIRQDPVVIQALLDFGVRYVNEDDVFDDPPSVKDAMMSVKDAMIVSAHIAAACAGGPGATFLQYIARPSLR